MTKKLLITAALLAALCGSVGAQTFVARHGELEVRGNKIYGKTSGEPVMMRGVSFFWNITNEIQGQTWPGGKFYTSGAVDHLVSNWKVNVVRAAVAKAATGSTNWQTVVSSAVSNGIYVIIDFHTHNYNDQSAAVTFFTAQAEAYKNTPNVIFEIFNEPCPSGGYGGTDCQGDNWNTQIKPYAVAVINAIRAKGANNLIVIGSPNYSKLRDPENTTNSAIANPVKGADLNNASYANNLAYAVHFYTAEPGTFHQGALRATCNLALNADLALLATEWGLSEADGGQTNKSKIDTVEAKAWFEWMDKNHVGWMAWSIVDKDEAASLVSNGQGTGGLTSNNLTAGGHFIRNWLNRYNEARTLTVNTVPASGGGTVDGTRSSYKYGDYITLTAKAADGWSFVNWTGSTASSDASIRVYLDANKTATATFEQGGNLIKNGVFANANCTGADWSCAGASGNIMTPASGGGALINIAATGTIVIRQGVTLENGKRYTLTFDARTVSGQRTVNVTAGAAGAYGSLAANLTSSMQSFTMQIDMTGTTGSVNISFNCGDQTGEWILNNVRLVASGNSTVSLPAIAARPAGWSLRSVGGAVTLVGGNDVGSGYRVTLYNLRGKSVRTVSARDGMVIDKNLPAGNYFAVVRNAAGKEVFRDRVVTVK